jgi:hypothetical protein
MSKTLVVKLGRLDDFAVYRDEDGGWRVHLPRAAVEEALAKPTPHRGGYLAAGAGGAGALLRAHGA